MFLVSFRPYLLPLTPSSDPASPSISEESGASEEDMAIEKGSTVDASNEEIKTGRYNKFLSF